MVLETISSCNGAPGFIKIRWMGLGLGNIHVGLLSHNHGEHNRNIILNSLTEGHYIEVGSWEGNEVTRFIFSLIV